MRTRAASSSLRSFSGLSPYWIGRGLRAAFVPQGGVLVDVLNRINPSTDSATKSFTERGPAADYASTRVTEFTNNARHGLPNGGTVVVGYYVRSFTNYTGLVFKQTGPTQSCTIELRHNGPTSTELACVRASAGAAVSSFNSTGASSATGAHVAAVRFTTNDLTNVPTFAQDGRLLTTSSSTSNGTVGDGGNFRIGRRTDGAVQLDGFVNVVLLFDVGLTDAELRLLTTRSGVWLPFISPQKSPLMPVVSSGTALNAALASQAAVTSAISTAIQASASVQAVVTIAAAMTTSIKAAAALAAQSSLSAGLSTSISTSASLQSQASITADLTTGAAVWASAPAAMSTIAASLSTSIQPAASLSAQSSLSGALTNVALFEAASGFKVSKLPYDPRLPLGVDPRALQARLYEVLRQVATVTNAHDDGYVSTVVNVSANYTMQRGDAVILVDATAGAVTVSLQSPAEAMHKTISVRKIDTSANTVAVVPPSGKVDGASTLVLTLASPKVTLASSGGSYYSV